MGARCCNHGDVYRKMAAALRTVVFTTVFSYAVALCIYGTTESNPAKTCREILLKNPDCYGKTGWYWLTCGGEEQLDPPVLHLCDMNRLGGGWMRIARRNFTDGNPCPGDWISYVGSNGLNYCTTPDGVPQAQWRINPKCPYSEVNGYILGDQKGLCEAFTGASQETSIKDNYVDGVSITYGNPKQHLYTYAVGREEKARLESCECHGSTYSDYPVFVGWDYLCDSGMKPYEAQASAIGKRVLWTGKGCDEQSSCCHTAGAPWFYRKLPLTANERIEIRIMSDDAHADEMVLLREIVMYIR